MRKKKSEGVATTLPLANTWKEQFDLSHRSSCTIKAFQGGGKKKMGQRGVYNSFLSLPTPCLFFQPAQNCGRLSRKHTVRRFRKPAWVSPSITECVNISYSALQFKGRRSTQNSHSWFISLNHTKMTMRGTSPYKVNQKSSVWSWARLTVCAEIGLGSLVSSHLPKTFQVNWLQ